MGDGRELSFTEISQQMNRCKQKLRPASGGAGKAKRDGIESGAPISSLNSSSSTKQSTARVVRRRNNSNSRNS